MANDCAVRRTILVPHVRDHYQVSPVLLSSSLLNEPGVSIHPCIKASFGGPRNIDITIVTPILRKMCIRQTTKDSLISHVSWIFYRQHDATDLMKVSDFSSYPKLMWLHKFELLPAVVTAGLCFLIAGWPGLVVGFLWSTVLLYHATFCINSLAHVHGRKRYVTGDDSHNNWLLALFAMGEGWHSNHHAYQSSAQQGFRWWEIDATY